MYIDVVPNRSSPPAILLRESIREGITIRKRTLANLSHWAPERVEALRRALRGEFDQGGASEPVCGPVFGVLYALKQMADEVGITSALGKSPQGKLALILTLARVAHQGSRLAAVRWAKDHAVAEVLGVSEFEEDELYKALDAVAKRQDKIEQTLYKRYVNRHGGAPALFLYDVTSSYQEGEQNELGEFGYNRDGKRGKQQIVVGLLTAVEGEPLAVRVFAGNTADPSTVPEQIKLLKQHFKVQEVVVVGDRGMIKSSGKQALREANLRYITALTDPQIRKLLKHGTLQLELFEERVGEVEAPGRRYILRKNAAQARKDHRRRAEKLTKLQARVGARNDHVARSPRCQPEAGLRQLKAWGKRHKVSAFVALTLEATQIRLQLDAAARDKAMELAGCYVIETDVPKALLEAQAVHDRYKDLAGVERDFRTLKTGLLEVRPVFVRKERRTRGHVFICMLALKLSRELQKRLSAAFGTTATNPHGVTLKDALAALGRLCLMTYRVNDSSPLTRLPHPDEEQTSILKALRVSLPRR